VVQLAHRLRIELALHDVRPGVVARRAGLHPSHLSRILHGHNQPTPEVLRRIELAIRTGPGWAGGLSSQDRR